MEVPVGPVNFRESLPCSACNILEPMLHPGCPVPKPYLLKRSIHLYEVNNAILCDWFHLTNFTYIFQISYKLIDFCLATYHHNIHLMVQLWYCMKSRTPACMAYYYRCNMAAKHANSHTIHIRKWAWLLYKHVALWSAVIGVLVTEDPWDLGDFVKRRVFPSVQGSYFFAIWTNGKFIWD